MTEDTAPYNEEDLTKITCDLDQYRSRGVNYARLESDFPLDSETLNALGNNIHGTEVIVFSREGYPSVDPDQQEEVVESYAQTWVDEAERLSKFETPKGVDAALSIAMGYTMGDYALRRAESEDGRVMSWKSLRKGLIDPTISEIDGLLTETEEKEIEKSRWLGLRKETETKTVEKGGIRGNSLTPNLSKRNTVFNAKNGYKQATRETRE